MLRKNADGEIEEVTEVVEVLNTDNIQQNISNLNKQINDLQARKAELKALLDTVNAEKAK